MCHTVLTVSTLESVKHRTSVLTGETESSRKYITYQLNTNVPGPMVVEHIEAVKCISNTPAYLLQLLHIAVESQGD